ncbi:uncharacterized protein LOC135842631 [Planococcus citri]|uniref:uncharacterized protein LOC135842631 n=1 Tax=Planococcus citri TaxID=170843 RepID=UPI0031F8FDB7
MRIVIQESDSDEPRNRANSVFNSVHRQQDIHPLNKNNEHLGEFNHLYPGLRKHPAKFFEYMRMSVETFDIILNKIKHFITKETTTFKRPLPPAERLMITLRYLATGLSFRQLAFSFRRGKSTIAEVIYETCAVIWDVFVHEYMPVPTEEHLKQVATDYYHRWKFPHCIGSIDGRHCQIRNPKHAGSTHLNYMKYFSIVLQGVADANKKFITIDVGGRGKQHDAATFRYSSLFQLLEEGQFNVPQDTNLPNSNIMAPFVLIGDEAYPLKTYLMRPYPQRGLTPENEIFNKKLSIARKCIECAFGILRAKWRFLSKEIETSPKHARILIRTACLLHNIVREHDGDSDADYLNTLNRIYNGNGNDIQNAGQGENFGPLQRHRNNNAVGTLPKLIREHFTQYFQTVQ